MIFILLESSSYYLFLMLRMEIMGSWVLVYLLMSIWLSFAFLSLWMGSGSGRLEVERDLFLRVIGDNFEFIYFIVYLNKLILLRNYLVTFNLIQQVKNWRRSFLIMNKHLLKFYNYNKILMDPSSQQTLRSFLLYIKEVAAYANNVNERVWSFKDTSED